MRPVLFYMTLARRTARRIDQEERRAVTALLSLHFGIALTTLDAGLEESRPMIYKYIEGVFRWSLFEQRWLFEHELIQTTIFFIY